MSSFLRVQCRHSSLITGLALSTEGASAMAACSTDSQAPGYMAMSTDHRRQFTVNSQQRASAFACAPSCCLSTRGLGGIPDSGACAYATATATGRWQVSWWRNPFPSQVATMPNVSPSSLRDTSSSRLFHDVYQSIDSNF